MPITSLSSRIKIGDGTVSWLGFSLSMRGFVYPALKFVEVELYKATGTHTQATGGDGLSPVIFTIPEEYRPTYDVTNALKGVLWSAGLGSIHVQKTGAVCYGLTYVRAVNDAGADTGNVFYSYE